MHLARDANDDCHVSPDLSLEVSTVHLRRGPSGLEGEQPEQRSLLSHYMVYTLSWEWMDAQGGPASHHRTPLSSHCSTVCAVQWGKAMGYRSGGGIATTSRARNQLESWSTCDF